VPKSRSGDVENVFSSESLLACIPVDAGNALDAADTRKLPGSVCGHCRKSSYLLFFWCLQRVPTEQAAIAATLDLRRGSAGLIWFSQALTLMQLVGGVLIVGAIT